MPKTAAIFDVDRTILDGMSGHLFSWFMWKEGMLSFKNKFRISLVFTGYRLGILPEEDLVKIGTTYCAGMKADDLKAAAKKCIKKKIGKRIFSEAIKAIEFHREKGDLVILASGSSSFIVQALAEKVGADRFAATSVKEKNGLCTKEVNLPLCYKEGKLILIQQVLKEEGILLQDCHLYSDNNVDLPVFHKVAHKHAVNPHDILMGQAKKHGWEILNWTTPVDSTYKVTGTSWPVKENSPP